MKVFTPDTIILLIGSALVLLLVQITGVNAAVINCTSNEPREYSFEIKDGQKGEYFQLIEFESGPKAGVAYAIRIKDVSKPNETDDYIKKTCITCPVKYRITYSLQCSKPL